MAYTPELCQEDSCTLRRIAWALGIPMTKAMAHIMDYIANAIDENKICEACREKTRCSNCAFNTK